VIGKAADNFDHHEQGGDDGGPFGARLGAGMAAAQEDVIARPDAMIVRTGRVIMLMSMVMVMTVPMGMPMCVIVKAVPMDVIVRHDASLAPSGYKSAL
jgi:hypothetical protein